MPVVVKADGLAAGKGVVICDTHARPSPPRPRCSPARCWARRREVVLEEFLDGEELTFFALCDGTHAVPIAAAQDHKRIGEGDTGPNTGGMGAYSTDALLPPPCASGSPSNVAQKVVDGMRSEDTPFVGMLFCGMMMAAREARPHGARVQHPLRRPRDPGPDDALDTDIIDLFDAAIDGTADTLAVKMKPGASVCVIAASGGYPGKVRERKSH